MKHAGILLSLLLARYEAKNPLAPLPAYYDAMIEKTERLQRAADARNFFRIHPFCR